MSNVSTKSLQELGSQLLESLTALIQVDGRLPRPTDLSRWWDLAQTLCVRTCGAPNQVNRYAGRLNNEGASPSFVRTACRGEELLADR